jgi:RNAse (barnase) inhibitor barstar
MAKGGVVAIDAAQITDWGGFHAVFAEAFGFPDWYGRNMDAWIDLMTYLDEDSATTSISVAPGEIVTIEVAGARRLRERLPEIYAALVECAAFVNWRRIERGGTAYLCLAFQD